MTAKAICSRNYLILVSSGIYLLHTLTWRYGQQPPTVIGLTIALNCWISLRTQKKHRLGPRVWGRYDLRELRGTIGGSSQKSQVSRITPVPTGHWPYFAYLWLMTGVTTYEWDEAPSGVTFRSSVVLRPATSQPLPCNQTWLPGKSIIYIWICLSIYRWFPLCLMTSKGRVLQIHWDKELLNMSESLDIFTETTLG